MYQERVGRACNLLVPEMYIPYYTNMYFVHSVSDDTSGGCAWLVAPFLGCPWGSDAAVVNAPLAAHPLGSQPRKAYLMDRVGDVLLDSRGLYARDRE